MPFSPKMLKNLYRWPASWLDKQLKHSQIFTGSHGIASQERRFLRFLERLLGAYFHHSSIWGYRAMAGLQIIRRLCNLQTFWPTCVLFWLFIYKSTSSRSPYSRFLAYNILKAKMAPHIAHSGHITSSRHFLKTQYDHTSHKIRHQTKLKFLWIPTRFKAIDWFKLSSLIQVIRPDHFLRSDSLEWNFC